MGFQDGNDISWTICKQSAPHSRQITTPTPRHSTFTCQMLFLPPNQQRQSTEGIMQLSTEAVSSQGRFGCVTPSMAMFDRVQHSRVEPDPYVVLQLGNQTRETREKEASTNPIWEQQFALMSDDPTLQELSVAVSVFLSQQAQQHTVRFH